MIKVDVLKARVALPPPAMTLSRAAAVHSGGLYQPFLDCHHARMRLHYLGLAMRAPKGILFWESSETSPSVVHRKGDVQLALVLRNGMVHCHSRWHVRRNNEGVIHIQCKQAPSP